VTPKTAAIVNPRSGGGKTGRQWTRIEAALRERLGPLEVRFTAHSGHGITLARELLDRGFDRLIAAGGDGTINEVANGFLENDVPVRPGACLGVLPLGTGGDFRRTLGIGGLRQALDALAGGTTLRIDVGKARFRSLDSATRTRYFVNLASFGMGGDVASRANNFLMPLGGAIAYLYASGVSLLRYRGKQVRLRLDDAAETLSLAIHNVAVGNGRFHGGGMQACPTAAPDDGVLEVTVIEYLRLWEAVRDFPILYSDNVYRHPKVRHLRAKRLVAEADEPVRIEIDGEPLGTLPLEIAALPGRLQVLVPPGWASTSSRATSSS